MTAAKADLRRLGLVDPALVEDGRVVRHAKGYPVYDRGHRERTDRIKACLSELVNLVSVGRCGQFRYNNMDHLIVTAWYGVGRLLCEPVDPWTAFDESAYLEAH